MFLKETNRILVGRSSWGVSFKRGALDEERIELS